MENKSKVLTHFQLIVLTLKKIFSPQQIISPLYCVSINTVYIMLYYCKQFSIFFKALMVKEGGFWETASLLQPVVFPCVRVIRSL